MIDLEKYKKKSKKWKREYLGRIKSIKVWMKDKENWNGVTVSLRLNKRQSMELSTLLREASNQTNEIDLTIYPKKPTPDLTVTYAKKSENEN